MRNQRGSFLDLYFKEETKMTKTEAVVAIVGILGVSSLGIVGMLTKRKEQKEFEAAKSEFDADHDLKQMVDLASVSNDKIKKPEDKAVAKDIMVKAKDSIDAASDLKTYKAAVKKFLELYSDLTDGEKDKIEANVLYYKNRMDRDEKLRAEKAAIQQQNKLVDKFYKHDLDKLAETRRLIEAVRPDAYTIGKIVKGTLDTVQAAANKTVVQEEPKTENT